MNLSLKKRNNLWLKFDRQYNNFAIVAFKKRLPMTLDLLRSLAKHGISNIEGFFLGPIYIYMKILVFTDISKNIG